MAEIIRFQFRRGTAAEWAAANPVLADGEPGVERDTGKQKIGDGVRTWNALPYTATKGDPGPAGVADDASVKALLDNPNSQTAGKLSATYAPAFADTGITYNVDGTVATVTEGGITTSYTYNADGTVATDSRTINGVTTTRAYTYTNGNLTGIEAA